MPDATSSGTSFPADRKWPDVKAQRRRGDHLSGASPCCCRAVAPSVPIRPASARRSPRLPSPRLVAGISIGSINAALIAGNPPDERVAKLRAFWIWSPDYPPSLAQATNLPRFLVLSQPDACEHDWPADPGTFDAAGDSAVNEQEQSQECCIWYMLIPTTLGTCEGRSRLFAHR
jgi:hypothetical protein